MPRSSAAWGVEVCGLGAVIGDFRGIGEGIVVADAAGLEPCQLGLEAGLKGREVFAVLRGPCGFRQGDEARPGHEIAAGLGDGGGFRPQAGLDAEHAAFFGGRELEWGGIRRA